MSKPVFTLVEDFSYVVPKIKKGRADKLLQIDLGKKSRRIKVSQVYGEYRKMFVGGKGYALKMLWDLVSDDTKWNSANNALCIASGPLGGARFPGAGKSTVATISPLTNLPIDSNVGGYFGPFLKFAGFDGMSISGTSGIDDNTVIFIDGKKGKIQIFKTQGLPELSHVLASSLTDHFGKKKPGGISVVSTGPGALYSNMGCLNFSWYDSGRRIVRYKQAGRGGTGTVFVNKGLKAIVVRWDKPVTGKILNPADPEALNRVSALYNGEIKNLDPEQNRMAVVGTTHLVEIMDKHGLLPCFNFRRGSHPDAKNLYANVFEQMFCRGFDGCWKGCPVACAHGVKGFVLKSGLYNGREVFVDGPEYETIASLGSNLGIFDPAFVIEANFYCDTYGIDTISFGVSLAFAMECFENGWITKKQTGGIDLRFGNKTAAMQILHQVGQGHGFGLVVGRGVRKIKEFVWCNGDRLKMEDRGILEDMGMEAKGLEFSLYITRGSLAQQGGYGFALKGPQHDEAWLIFLDQVKKLIWTFKDKAEALYWFPMWRTWFSLMGLCKLPWNDIVPEDNARNPLDVSDPNAQAKVPGHVQWYCDFYSAVTGEFVEPGDLITMSERIYNFQKIFNLRMSGGRREQDAIPYRAIGPATKEEYLYSSNYYDDILLKEFGIEDFKDLPLGFKMQIFRGRKLEAYERLKLKAYERRGWNENGIPIIETLKRVGLDLDWITRVIKQGKKGVRK